jgi:phosphate-selective porin OprO/OprP
MSIRRLVALSLFVMLIAPAVRGQSPADNAVGDRLNAIESQLRELKQSLARLTPRPNDGSDGAAADAARVEALEQQIKILARKMELEREQAAESAKQTPSIRAGRDGFSLRAPDGSFQLRLRGYLHSDARVYLDDRQNAADSFLLRRVRPIFEGTVFKQFDFRLMPDFGEGKTVLQDAYLDARFHRYFQVRAGKFKAPVGLERLASATEILFVERALPTALVPNRDVGVMLHGDSPRGRVTYAAGVFNGVVDGGSTDGDDQDGKDIVGRVFVLPFARAKSDALRGAGIGVAGSYGIQRGTAAAPNLATYKTAGQQTFFRYRSGGGEAGTTVADGVHARVSLQGYYYRGPAGLLAEHVLSSQRLRRGTQTIVARNLAWQVAGSWVLTGEKASYRGVTPARAFDRAAGAWGALELTARYNGLGVDPGVIPYFADPASSARSARAAAAGVNWYLNPSVKLAAEYERTQFRGGAAASNRPTEHDVLTRFQISF